MSAGLLALLAAGLVALAGCASGAGQPSPTPSPTPSRTAPPLTGVTLQGKTFTTYEVPAGSFNVVFDHCTFRGGTASAAVLTLDRPCHGLTFRDCVIAAGGGWNGITINVTNGDIFDVSFVGCRIAGQGRMGFECTQRPVSDVVGYHAIDLIGCTFAPQGSEAVSYDGGGGCRDCTISRCLIEGAGDSRAPYGAGLEINGPVGFTVADTTIWACRDSGFNLNCAAADCGWVFRNDVVDFSHRAQHVPVNADAARLILAGGMNGSVWQNCRLVLGDAWNAGYWRSCSSNDLSTSTLSGSPPANQGRALWTLDAASRGNKLPAHLG